MQKVSMKTALIPLLVLMTIPVIAQFGITTSIPQYRKGKVVTHEKDTLIGSFKIKGFSFKVLAVGESRAQKIPKSDIIAYAYDYDNSWYQRFKDGYYRLLTDGQVQLFRKIETSSYYDPTTNTSTQAHTKYYAVKRKNEPDLTLLRVTGSIGYDRSYFRSKASFYFQDAPEIVESIKAGHYRHESSISSLVERYNEWLEYQEAMKQEKSKEKKLQD